MTECEGSRSPGAEKPVSQFDPGDRSGTTHCCSRPGKHARQILLQPGTPLGLPVRRGPMDVVYPGCSGLDVHKKPVVACVIVPGAKGKPQKTIRTFGTMTDDLLALGDWLAE